MYSRTVTLEKNRRFSESLTWQIQRDFFKQQGVQAWVGQVPYYITSNPYVAYQYADMAMGMIKDYVQQKKYDPSQPFYIMEIGTGPGRFSFFMLNTLLELRKNWGLDAVKLCYVMTDFAGSNLPFWESHPQLQSLLETGTLDFALYDIEQDDSFTLMRSGETVKPGSLHNPPTAILNYVFDSIPHDVFRVEAGTLMESLTKITSPSNNLKKKVPIKTEALTITFEHKPIQAQGYYADPQLNAVLQQYQNAFSNTTFSIPIAGILGINRLRALSSHHQLLFLTSDKGYALAEEVAHLSDPRMAIHGNCFSMMVNYHAAGEYVKNSGGQAVMQTARKGIKTCAFWYGPSMDTLPEMRHALHTHIVDFGLSDFFHLHTHLKKAQDNIDLAHLLSHMHFCRWDPHIFRIFGPHLHNHIEQAPAIIQSGFLQGMAALHANFYFMPNKHDVFIHMALISHKLKKYAQAVQYYTLSLQYFESHFSTVYNLGVCHYVLDEFDQSLARFKEAAAYSDQDTDKAREWIVRIEHELSDAH